MGSSAERLYDLDSSPRPGFNLLIRDWLSGNTLVREHRKPAALHGVLTKYLEAVELAEQTGLSRRDAHRAALSELTKLLLGHDLSAELVSRLAAQTVNVGGFRTTLSQGVAKNVGENFVNIIVYALADLLSHQDTILIDKGVPPALRKAITLRRKVTLKTGVREIHIPIESDASIFSRTDPRSAILISAKTRLKEVFHIGTMWKILFDVLGDDNCQRKWGLHRDSSEPVSNMLYVFATADMVSSEGRKTQGPDVERTEPRNLIAMDASFFDYVFVSKVGIAHVDNQLSIGQRGALFHELGCIIDLVEQKFEVKL